MRLPRAVVEGAGNGLEDSLVLATQVLYRDRISHHGLLSRGGGTQFVKAAHRNDGEARSQCQHNSHPAQASRSTATAASAAARRAASPAAAVRLAVR